jgi:predicted nucleic acid-binding protein
MIVISDSTVFIGLAKIEKLSLLSNIFQKVYVPEAVYNEVVEKGRKKPGAKEVRESLWIIKKKVSDNTQVNLLMVSLERGEAETLVLAKEMEADIILLDEEKARKSAVLAGFKVIGLIGILIIAKQMGLIKNIKPYIETLQEKNFRISNKIVNKALKQAGE